MTDHEPITRRTVLAALPLAGAAAVLPVAAANGTLAHHSDADEPDNPMERMRRHARAIRDILVSEPYAGQWRLSIDPVGNILSLDDVDRALRLWTERIGSAS